MLQNEARNTNSDTHKRTFKLHVAFIMKVVNINDKTFQSTVVAFIKVVNIDHFVNFLCLEKQCKRAVGQWAAFEATLTRVRQVCGIYKEFSLANQSTVKVQQHLLKPKVKELLKLFEKGNRIVIHFTSVAGMYSYVRWEHPVHISTFKCPALNLILLHVSFFFL